MRRPLAGRLHRATPHDASLRGRAAYLHVGLVAGARPLTPHIPHRPFVALIPLVLLLVATMVVLSSSPARANTRLVIADGISILMPRGFQHTVTRPEEGAGGVTLFEVRDGPDALVVVIYRASPGKAAPGANQALELHADELATRLGTATRVRREALGISLLGARRPTHHLHHVAHERLAWVVAADLGSEGRANGRALTVVCSALHLPGSPNAAAFMRMAESLMSAR